MAESMGYLNHSLSMLFSHLIEVPELWVQKAWKNAAMFPEVFGTLH